MGLRPIQKTTTNKERNCKEKCLVMVWLPPERLRWCVLYYSRERDETQTAPMHSAFPAAMRCAFGGHNSAGDLYGGRQTVRNRIPSLPRHPKHPASRRCRLWRGLGRL